MTCQTPQVQEIIEALKKNTSAAVPVVLRRLKQKDEEWQKVKRQCEKSWRAANAENLPKSLDSQVRGSGLVSRAVACRRWMALSFFFPALMLLGPVSEPIRRHPGSRGLGVWGKVAPAESRALGHEYLFA